MSVWPVTSMFKSSPQIKFADLKTVVTTRITFNQLPFLWRTDFIKLSSEKVLVPITIELDNRNLEFKKEMQFNRASVNVYGMVTTLQGRIEAEFENEISAEYTDEFFEAGKSKRSIYQKIVMLNAGQRYRLDLILKDLNSKYVGSMSYRDHGAEVRWRRAAVEHYHPGERA